MALLQTDNLTIGYDNKKLISDINMELEKGKIITLIGPNGSGKTTLLKTVAGLLKEVSGAVYLEEKSLQNLDSNEQSKLMSVMLTQRSKYDYATCRDVISVGRYPYTGVLGKISQKDEEVIKSVMELVGVTELADRDFNRISDGQRQRVLLARALVQEPKVLLLDEPTSFLDVGYKIEFMNILKKLAYSKGIGVLMSLHEIDLAATVSDKIVAITLDNRIDKIDVPGKVLTTRYISELFNIRDGQYSVNGGFTLASMSDKDANSDDGQNKKDRTVCMTGDDHTKNTRFIMVQGTMSSAGKSLIVAGLCRIFKQDGYKVAPFKSQNMALNSYITEDGMEMGRAQVMQAEAAGVKPDVHMNPILLKPTDDQGSQVIVNGKVYGNMRAREYFGFKKSLIPEIEHAIECLKKDYDIIVIEGAGSPAEINLKQNDIVNMGMAKLVDAPVILVGDIDRGGVFAQLIGTLDLLEEDERNRVKGLIINKFRGDKTILDPGIDMLIKRGRTDVVGVVPYMDIKLEDEDSLTERFNKKSKGIIDIAVVRLPHISNFTDFDVFEQLDEVSVRYISNTSQLEGADLVILPGSKNTIADMKWIRQGGFDAAIERIARNNIPVIGICGGFQMLGEKIDDPTGVEGGGECSGIGLLPVYTTLMEDKCQQQVEGILPQISGVFESLTGANYYGYEIHMGETRYTDRDNMTDGEVLISSGNVYGTYVHGIFDHEDISRRIISALSKIKNVSVDVEQLVDYKSFKESEYDRLAKVLREHLDMDKIYAMMEE